MASNGDIVIDVFENDGRSKGGLTNPDSCVMKHLLREDFWRAPKEFRRGQNIKEYVKSVKEYCEAVGASAKDQLYIMVNNLEEEVRYELFALPDYNEHTTDGSWIEKTLI